MRLPDIQIKRLGGGNDFSVCIEDIDEISGLWRDNRKFKIAIIISFRRLNEFNGRVYKLYGRSADRVEAVSVLHLPIYARLPKSANACKPKHPCADKKPNKISHLFIPDCAWRKRAITGEQLYRDIQKANDRTIELQLMNPITGDKVTGESISQQMVKNPEESNQRRSEKFFPRSSLDRIFSITYHSGSIQPESSVIRISQPA